MHQRILVSLFFSILSTVSFAGNEKFQFTDPSGFELCLGQVPPKVGKRTMTKLEIADKCLSQAEKNVTAKPKDMEAIKGYLTATKRGSAPENALPFMRAWIDLDVKACEDVDGWDVLIAAISHPDAYPSASVSFAKTGRALITKCLKNPTSKADFIEELETNEDSYVKNNLCQLLKAAGVGPKC